MEKGWIKIKKDITEHWLWSDSEYLKWWLDLVILSAWNERKVLADGELLILKRGQLATSIRKLQLRWAKKNKLGLPVKMPSKKTIQHFLQLLAEDGMVQIQTRVQSLEQIRVHHMTLITICDYVSYDDDGNTNGYSAGYSIGDREKESEKESEKAKENFPPIPPL